LKRWKQSKDQRVLRRTLDWFQCTSLEIALIMVQALRHPLDNKSPIKGELADPVCRQQIR